MVITRRLFSLYVIYSLLFFNIDYPMTEKEKREKLEELENLKLLLRFHSENRIIKLDKQYMDYVDEILDEINRIEKELKDEEQQ